MRGSSLARSPPRAFPVLGSAASRLSGGGAPIRKWTLSLMALSTLATACAPQEYHANTPARYQTAAGCAQVNRDNLYAAAG